MNRPGRFSQCAHLGQDSPPSPTEQIKLSINVPSGEYHLVLKGTKPSDDDSHRECDKADGFSPRRCRILDTRSENFWATNFTSISLHWASFVPASPAGAVACQCVRQRRSLPHLLRDARRAALNSQAYVDPTLKTAEKHDAGYKNNA